MLTIRRAHERGRTRLDWLQSRHSFSFGQYHDPRHIAFGPLRVINDDVIDGGAGFPMHPHRDMEIITYVLDGALEHRDSTGGGGVIRPGMVQRMSAGTGVMHSEFNHSTTDPARLLQVWIIPDQPGHEPRYDDAEFPAAGRRGALQLIASPDGADGSLDIHQDARIFAGLFDAGESAELALGAGRRAWVQVARGTVTVNGETLDEGDAAAIEDEPAVTIEGVASGGGGGGGEVLVFDLTG